MTKHGRTQDDKCRVPEREAYFPENERLHDVCIYNRSKPCYPIRGVCDCVKSPWWGQE
jgi:hypothetical protein